MYVCTVWLIGVGQAHPIVGPVVYRDDTWLESTSNSLCNVELLDEVTIPYKTLMSIAMH